MYPINFRLSHNGHFLDFRFEPITEDESYLLEDEDISISYDHRQFYVKHELYNNELLYGEFISNTFTDNIYLFPLLAHIHSSVQLEVVKDRKSLDERFKRGVGFDTSFKGFVVVKTTNFKENDILDLDRMFECANIYIKNYNRYLNEVRYHLVISKLVNNEEHYLCDTNGFVDEIQEFIFEQGLISEDQKELVLQHLSKL